MKGGRKKGARFPHTISDEFCHLCYQVYLEISKLRLRLGSFDCFSGTVSNRSGSPLLSFLAIFQSILVKTPSKAKVPLAYLRYKLGCVSDNAHVFDIAGHDASVLLDCASVDLA